MTQALPRDAKMTVSLGSAAPVLFADRGCPFAHRVLALLDHLGTTPALYESPVGEKPMEMAEYSHSQQIPLLVQGDLVIAESRVMLEHLAEHYGFVDAFPEDLGARTLHRYAMSVVDRFIASWLMTVDTDLDRAVLEDSLRTLEAAIATAPPRPSLLVFHIAPIWLRCRWWKPSGSLTRAVAARTNLCNWLDASVQLDAITNTAPGRAAHLADFAREQSSRRNP